MKLVNWNVTNSAPQRIDRQIRWLRRHDADVLALTEVNCRHLPHWQDRLARRGYWLAAPVEVTETGKGALLASRFPGHAIGPLFSHPMPQCSVSAKVDAPFGEMELHAIYARADGNRSWDKKFRAHILRAVADGIARRTGAQLVTGDFNSPQAELGERIVTFSEYRNAAGEWRLPAKSKHMKEIMFKHEAELAIRKPRKDMVDAFVERAADDSPRASWRHYRLDHIILSRTILPAAVRYRPVGRSLSDHSAMIADW